MNDSTAAQEVRAEVAETLINDLKTLREPSPFYCKEHDFTYKNFTSYRAHCHKFHRKNDTEKSDLEREDKRPRSVANDDDDDGDDDDVYEDDGEVDEDYEDEGDDSDNAEVEVNLSTDETRSVGEEETGKIPTIEDVRQKFAVAVSAMLQYFHKNVNMTCEADVDSDLVCEVTEYIMTNVTSKRAIAKVKDKSLSGLQRLESEDKLLLAYGNVDYIDTTLRAYDRVMTETHQLSDRAQELHEARKKILHNIGNWHVDKFLHQQKNPNEITSSFNSIAIDKDNIGENFSNRHKKRKTIE